MTVNELIEQLKKQDPNAKVYFCLDRELELENDYFAIGTNVYRIEKDCLYDFDDQFRGKEDTLEDLEDQLLDDVLSESEVKKKALEKLETLEKLDGVFIRIDCN